MRARTPKVGCSRSRPNCETSSHDSWREPASLQLATGQLIPWVFHRDGKPIKDYYGGWDEACRLAGYPDRVAHDLRRTAVRNLERAGVPRSAAMKMTGHKTESVYRRYAIVDEAMLRESAEKLAAFHYGEKRSGRKIVSLEASRPRDSR